MNFPAPHFRRFSAWRVPFQIIRPPGILSAIFGLLALFLAVPGEASAPPRAGERTRPPAATAGGANGQIRIARASWDTGWFQTEIYRELIRELGYQVPPPRTMENRDFYEAAARGEMDLWANGWFPLHDRYLNDPDVGPYLEKVGYEVRAGALQGYLADRKTVEALGIRGLGALRNPEVAAVFDADGNGKADLIGCNAGWGCEAVIDHHIDVYGLTETVEHVQGDYGPLLAETVERFRRGEPVLFYTWTPNWTVGELAPGRDVVWLQVPYPHLPGEDAAHRARARVPDVPGCPDDPCLLGFPPSDIRVVANANFLERHPEVARLVREAEIPLDDILDQNARMVDGEDGEADIRRHAREWILENREMVGRWMGAARNAGSHSGGEEAPESGAPIAADGSQGSGDPVSAMGVQTLRVATKPLAPFVVYENRNYGGFSIDLWAHIAREVGLRYELYGVNTNAKLLDDVERGAADVSIAGIGITSRREANLDFSHPYFETGLQIMIRDESKSLAHEILDRILAVLVSRELFMGVGVFLLVLLMAGHLIWLLERRSNPEFPPAYGQGVWNGLWWAVVTVTTVGYGDKTPKGRGGRVFGVFWILAGYFVFAYFTATVTTTVTVQALHGAIDGPEDLFGKKLATVARSPAADYLSQMGLSVRKHPTEAEAFQALESGTVDAVVYDAPVLQHYAAHEGQGKVHVVGLVFWEQNYGIALPPQSPLREPINRALLRLIETGQYRELHQKWFG
jgi:ABC-type proline/glycine betaine transport system substrate-binding protein